MANAESEPKLTRRQMMGEVIMWTGLATGVGSILGYGADLRISKAKADASVPSSPVTEEEYKAAKKIINQSDKTILNAANEERFKDIPNIVEQRKQARWEINVFEKRKENINALTEQIRISHEPDMYPILAGGYIGLIGAFVGFAMRVRGQSTPIKPPQLEAPPTG